MNYTTILINIRKIIRAVNLESKKLEKDFGLSIPQLLCLRFLNAQADFQANHTAIKSYLQLNASTVTGIISRLEQKGYVHRLPHQLDKRHGLVLLTAAGAAILENAPQSLHSQLSQKLQTLSKQQLHELQHAFDFIIATLSIENIEAVPIVTAGPQISSVGAGNV